MKTNLQPLRLRIGTFYCKLGIFVGCGLLNPIVCAIAQDTEGGATTGGGSISDVEIRGINAGGIDLPGPQTSGPPAAPEGRSTDVGEGHGGTTQGHPSGPPPASPLTKPDDGFGVFPSRTPEYLSGTARLTPSALRTILKIAKAYQEKFGNSLHVTSGSRTAAQQAKEMYAMLKSDSQNHPKVEGISKYHDTVQANEIKRAFDSNSNREKATAAIEKILKEYAAKGHPISLHMTERGAADLRTTGLTDKQKEYLFETCKENHVHCLFEVPAAQSTHAQALTKDFGVAVRPAPHEHLHVDAESEHNVNDPLEVPDFWTNHGFVPNSDEPMFSEWNKIDPNVWVEACPSTSKSSGEIHLWKTAGSQKIGELNCVKLREVGFDLKKVVPEHLCWITPPDEKVFILRPFKTTQGSERAEDGVIKEEMVYPTDDYWSSDASAGTNAPPRSTAALKTYTVQSGDTGVKISKRFGMGVEEFIVMNPGKLHVGQEVNVWDQRE